MAANIYRATILLALLASGSMTSTVNAQEMPLDGSRPPVISMAEAEKSNPRTPQSTQAPTQSGTPLPAPAAGVQAGQGIVAEVVRQAPPPRMKFRAPAANVVFEPGKNQTFAISRGHLNRFVLPFRDPIIRTTVDDKLFNTALVGNILEVASQQDMPAGFFIYDRSTPEKAISLTLIPQDDIPPVSSMLSLNGWTESDSGLRRSGSASKALAREGDHPYLELITSLLRDVAKGIIPDGYGFEALSGHELAGAPRCEIPGIHVQQMQLLTGGAYKVFVAKATNTSYSTNEIREDLCSGRELRAVAAWPDTKLGAGKSTELYLVVGTQTDPYEAANRPSLVGSN